MAAEIATFAGSNGCAFSPIPEWTDYAVVFCLNLCTIAPAPVERISGARSATSSRPPRHLGSNWVDMTMTLASQLPGCRLPALSTYTGPVNPQRLTVEQAAAHLGVSVRTVRRRIHTKELEHEKEPLAQGFRYWVLLTLPEPELATSVQDTVPAPGTPAEGATVALLAEVTAERDWLRGQVEELTRQAGNYQVLLLQSQEKIRLLEAGQPASQRVDTSMTAASQTDGQRPVAPDRPSWWRRLFGGRAN